MYQCHIDPAGELLPPAAEPAEGLRRDAEKRGQAFDPLLQQLLAVHENQSVDAAARDEPCRHNGLAECCRGRQHTNIVSCQGVRRQLLLGPQFTLEAHVDRRPRKPLIARRRRYAQRGEQVLRFPEAATR